jgi:hypothetical protein
MPSSTGDLDVIAHRRLALRALPPSEFRDDYLLYLDGLERKARAALAPAEGPGRGRDGDDADAGGWSVERSLLAAAGSLVFAYGVWALTSLL